MITPPVRSWCDKYASRDQECMRYKSDGPIKRTTVPPFKQTIYDVINTYRMPIRWHGTQTGACYLFALQICVRRSTQIGIYVNLAALVIAINFSYSRLADLYRRVRMVHPNESKNCPKTSVQTCRIRDWCCKAFAMSSWRELSDQRLLSKMYINCHLLQTCGATPNNEST